MLTLRFLGLALACSALFLLGALAPLFTPIAIGALLGLIAITWLDRRTAGTVDQFRIRRIHDAKLSLGASNRVAIEIESRAPRPLTITVRDEPPLLFAGADTATLHADLKPREAVTLDYHLRPLKRGDFAFGDLNLRWSSPLGLYTRQAPHPAMQAVKVYPNLHELRKYDLLVRRDQLAEMGMKNVRLRGEGTDFESLREYTSGDPYRSINWKATARRGKPISTDYEPERSQRVIAVLDVGRMMRSPIRVDDPSGESWNMAKADFVINSVLLFSYVATQKGDQVGLLVFADQVQTYIPPKAGRAHFQQLLEAMYALESQPVEADYGPALDFLQAQLKKRALVVLFTDLSGLRAGEMLMKRVPSLRPRHLPLVVTIRDPALDSEAHADLLDSGAAYRRAVAQEMIDERRVLLDTLESAGVLTLDVDAEHLTMAVVNRYLALKARL